VSERPTEPPTSGLAVEVPPLGAEWQPTVTVHPYPGKAAWTFWPDFWQLATVRST
jgi:hypothetical protein